MAKWGPGCSSTTGLLEEIGPVLFIPKEKQPVLNEYAWNKNANIFFIESPGGVGFSKLDNLSFFYNDTIQAVSLNIAVQNFFKIFSEYQNHTFFITGESYAGTYIPHLVREMFNYMDNNPDAIQLKLKGILIGNPYTFEDVDFEDSMLEFGVSHALISMETYEKYLIECPHWPQVENIYPFYNESNDYKYDPIIMNYVMPWKLVTKACNEVRNETKQNFEGINFYGIYKTCLINANITELKEGFENIDYEESNMYSEQNHFKKMIMKLKKEKYYENLSNNFKFVNNQSSDNDTDNKTENEVAIDFFPGCYSDKYTYNFLNNETIKEKLGVNKSIKHLSCKELNYSWGDSLDFYKKDIKELSKKKNFSSWLFSGTEDIAVTTLGTLRFLNKLNYPIKKKWKNWIVDGKIAGKEQSYDYDIRFLTVKGVGHMVPEDNPKIAKNLLDKFLEYNIKGEENPIPDKKEKEKGFPVYAIVLIAIFGILIIIGIILFILRTRKKNNNIENVDDTSLKLMNENL